MKKIILSLIAVAVGTLSSFAQSDLVATLSHGSSLSTFSGIDALAQAYEAAVEGDVITLSPGVFNAVNIEKAITVRGAGMQPMESNGYVATQLSGQMVVKVPSNTFSILTLEGVQVLGASNIMGSSLAPVHFIGVRFEDEVAAAGVSANATSCIFGKRLWSKSYISLSGIGSSSGSTTLNCFNCVMAILSSDGLSNSIVAKIVATNCIFRANYDALHYSNLTNCIVISGTDSGSPLPLPGTCNAHNCVGINSRSTPDLFSNILDPSNAMAEGFNIFKTLTWLGASPAFTETFELTETAAATYLGDDGTQVGIYGGTNPFNPTPTNPQVKKFTVNSTTVGDQLKVKINVE